MCACLSCGRQVGGAIKKLSVYEILASTVTRSCPPPTHTHGHMCFCLLIDVWFARIAGWYCSLVASEILASTTAPPTPHPCPTTPAVQCHALLYCVCLQVGGAVKKLSVDDILESTSTHSCSPPLPPTQVDPLCLLIDNCDACTAGWCCHQESVCG